MVPSPLCLAGAFLVWFRRVLLIRLWQRLELPFLHQQPRVQLLALRPLGAQAGLKREKKKTERKKNTRINVSHIWGGVASKLVPQLIHPPPTPPFR